jgi:hypothetical protein
MVSVLHPPHLPQCPAAQTASSTTVRQPWTVAAPIAHPARVARPVTMMTIVDPATASSHSAVAALIAAFCG